MAGDSRRHRRAGPTLRAAAPRVIGPGSGDVLVEAAGVVTDFVAIGDVILGGVPMAGSTQPIRQEAEAVQPLGDLALGHRRALGAGVMVGIIADHFRCAIAR